MASKEDSTGGTTPKKEKAVRAVTEVGGVRSSEETAPDLSAKGSTLIGEGVNS